MGLAAASGVEFCGTGAAGLQRPLSTLSGLMVGKRMEELRRFLLGVALIALAACASGPGIRGHLSAQQVEEFMERGLVARIFAGHDRIVVTMDSGDMYTARLPDMDKLATYAKHRESIGKPLIYEME